MDAYLYPKTIKIAIKLRKVSKMDKKLHAGVGERLRSFRRSLNKRQNVLAKELGISPLSLSRMENSTRYPDVELLSKIAKQYDCDLHWLLTGNKRKGSDEEIQIPLFNKLSASLIDSPNQDVDALLSIPDAPANAVACKCADDACAPQVSSGDTVVFEPGACEAGDMVVVCNEWGRALVRRKQAHVGQIVYVADNKGYEHLEGTEVKCLGKVWGMIRSFGKT